MPTYPVRAPNGKTYPVTGPAGASDAELIAQVIKAYPESQFPSREQTRQDRATAAAPTTPATAATRAPARGLGSILGGAAKAAANSILPGGATMGETFLRALTDPKTLQHDIPEIQKKELPYLFSGERLELPARAVIQAGLDSVLNPALPMQYAMNAMNPQESARQIVNAFTSKTKLPPLAPTPTQMAKTALTQVIGNKISELIPESGKQTVRQESQRNLEARRAAQERLQAKAPDLQNPVLSGVQAGVESTLEAAPAIAAGLLTRSPTVAMAMMGAQAGFGEYGDVRQRGGTPQDAALAGTLTGGIEVLTEKLPVGVIINKFGRVGFGRFVGELLAKDLIGEELATATQNAVDTAIANPDATWSEYVKQLGPNAAQTAISTLVQAGLVGGASSGARALKQQVTKLGREAPTPLPVPMQDADKVRTMGAPPAPPTLAPPTAGPATPTSAAAVRQQIINRFKTRSGANQEDAERWADQYIAQFPEVTETPDADTGAPIPGGPRPSVPDAVGATPDAGPTAPVAGDEPGGLGEDIGATSPTNVGERSAGVPLTPLTPETFNAAKADVTEAFEANKEDLGLEELDPKRLAEAAKIIAQDPNIAPIDALNNVLEKADQTAAPTPTPTETAPVEAEPTRAEKQQNASKVLKDKTSPLNARVEAATTLINYKFRLDDDAVTKTAALHLANRRTDDIETALEAARQGVTPAKIKPVNTAAIAPTDAAPAPTAQNLGDLGQMGTAIVDNMYGPLLDKVEKGVVTEAGAPSALLQVAKKIKDAGGEVTREVLRQISDGLDTARASGDFQAGAKKLVADMSPKPSEAAPEEETGHMVGAVHQAAQNILSNFMVGDRVQVGPSQGIVVGLDGDHVRVHPDSAKNPKAYNRISKAQVKLVSRPDSAATVSASKTPDQETKFGTEAGQLNADMAGLIQLLGANMYAANLADVSVKELLQNAFDAVKGAVSSKKAPALYEAGRIEITLDSQERTITIKDNARGMTPDIVRDAFFTVAGSDKSDLSPEDRSGGLGLAKMGFMMGAERLVLDTVRDGVRVRVDATSKDIAGSNFKITKSAAPKDEHGTTVTVKVPETYTDSKTGEAKTIWFPYSKGSVDILEKPLIGPVEVQFTYKRAYGDPEVETLPMGVNFPYDKYQKLTVNFDWGTADIYYGKEHKKSPSHQVLSSGVYQFNERFKLSQTETIPYDIIVNVKAAVEAKHPDYPFENSRERFKGRLKEDMSSLGLYLAKIARGAEAADLKETMQNVVSLPRVEIGENPDALEGKLEKSFEKKDTAKGQHELPTMPKEVFISDKGVLDNKGHVVVDSAKEAEKKKQSTFEAEPAAPTSEDFMIEIDQDPKNPIFHNNTSFDPIEVGKPYGNPAAFFAELGSILVEMKELLAQSGRYGYDVLSPENMFYAGIAIDKQYGGLHIKVPYKAVLINPFYDWGARTLAGVRANILNVMIHEIAHTGDMRHGEGHNAEMVKTELYLADEGMLDYFRDAIMDTLLRHESTFTAMRDEYGRSTTQNVAKSLEDIGKEASAGSAARRDDGGSENAPRAVPAGGGRGGGSNLRAASQNNSKREKLGGSGKASAGIAAAKAKISKGLRQAQQAADAKDFMDGLSTISEGRDGDTFIPLLMDNFADLDIEVKRALLNQAVPMSRIVGKYESRLPALKRLQRVEQQARGMRSRMTRAFAFHLKTMTSFVGKNGKRVLGMTMHTARINSVDPTAHKNVAEAIKNDKVIKFYENLLTDPALSVNQKAAYKGKITLRTTQIRDVYSLWAYLGEQKGGHELYISTRQYYKDMFAAIRAETTTRIDRLPIPDKDKQKLKDATLKERSDDKPEKGDLFPEVPDSAFPPEYFPLKRYGKFWLRINHPKSGTGREFHTFESAGKRNAYLRMRARELGADPTSQKFFPKGNDVASLRTEFMNDSAMLKEMFAIIDKAVPESSTKLDPKALENLRAEFFQVWLLTLPERSIRKQFLRAQKITGFDNDVTRNFASTSQAYATQLAKLKFAPLLQAELAAARDTITEDIKSNEEAETLNMVVDAMQKRVSNVLNPTPQSKLGEILNTSAFVSLLTSVATALLQPSSIPIRVMPKLNVKYGYRASAAKFTRLLAVWDTLSMTEVGPDGTTHIVAPTFGSSPYVQNHPVRKRLFEAMRDDRDAFAQHSEHADLRRVALGQNGSVSNIANLVVEGMALPLSTMERLSREMTGLMAAELEYAKTKDEDKAVNVAMDIIGDTLGDYGTFERPPIMQNELGRVALQFKMYAAVQTKFLYESTETIVGEAIAAALPGEKNRGARLKASVDAAHELAGVLIMVALIGGAPALPLYGFICLLINILSSRDSEKRRERIRRDPLLADDSDGRFRYQFLSDHFGQFPPLTGLDGKLHYWDEIAERGLVSELSGVSIGPRISLNGMWFREPREGRTWGETSQNWLMDNFAPSVSTGMNIIGAVEDWSKGDIGRGFEKALPAAYKGSVTAKRLATEGLERKSGDKAMSSDEISDFAILTQTLGFQPNEVADVQKRTSKYLKDKNRAENAKSAVLKDLNETRYDPDSRPEDIHKAELRIVQYNQRYPYPPYLITNKVADDSWSSFTSQRKSTIRGLPVSKKARSQAMPFFTYVPPPSQ